MSLTQLLDLFNLIDRADGIRGSVVSLLMGKGGGVYFEVLPVGGSCGGDVERMLRRYGIGMWGKRVTRDNVDDETMAPWWIGFNVRKSQAAWANYLIQRRGHHVGNKPTDAAAVHAVGMPVSWEERARGEVAAAGRAKPGPPAKAEKPKRSWFDGVL